MDYVQVSIYTTTEGVEPVGALLLELGAGGYAVQDAADFQAFLDGKSGHWDYIDEELMKLREAETTLSVYLAGDEQGARQLERLEQGLLRLRSLDTAGEWGRLNFQLAEVREQDWAEAWKQYYKPVRTGPRLTICPSWEDYAPEPGEVVLWMDPGMAFGTGTHESTQLCLGLLEEIMGYLPGAEVLDLGCGSGILAVAALLLGAGRAIGCDIDEVAVRVAEENARRNGVADKADFFRGSLPEVEERYQVVLANIVADVILSFVPGLTRVLAPGGVVIASGIIDDREEEVYDALVKKGFIISRIQRAGGWVALAAELDPDRQPKTEQGGDIIAALFS